MIQRIHYKMNSHQKEFHDDKDSKFLHLSAGYGSGKSYALCMKLIDLSMRNKPYAGGLLCPSFKDLKRDILPIFEEICEKNKINFFYHKTEYYIQFPWSPGKLYLFTAENKLRGPNLAYIGINEATIIEEERYKEAIARIRIKNAKVPQIVSNGTPEGISNYIYELFIDNPIKGSKIIYGDTRNNIENLHESYIESLERSFDKKMLDAYLKGMWINMNGNQFYYSYDPLNNENKNIKQKDLMNIHVGLDFNVDYMTATCWNFDGHTLLGFDEIVLEKNANTKKMCDALKARGYTPDITIIYPDPAGAARSTKGNPDHEILRQNGFHNIRVKFTQPRMRQRQLNVNNLLDKRQIIYNPTVMKELRKDLISVNQDPVTLEKSKKDPKRTHASDGLDYMCDILFEFSGRKPDSRVITFR